MRFMSFWTNRGRKAAWGFPSTENATRAVALPDRPGSYLAAIRGNEGRPLPPELGGYKKRCVCLFVFVFCCLFV